MLQKNLSLALALTGSLLLVSAGTSYAYSSYGSQVNTACTPAKPYTGSCTLCHDTSDYAIMTPAKTAFLAGGTTLTDFFCPSGPACTDSDGDGYAVEGGACGPVDCNDTDPAVNPGAAENCTDGIDNNCNGLIDAQDPAAVGCPQTCTDNDHDGYAIEGGACGPVDCNDADPAINPGAQEICGDAIDNNCNGQIDEGCNAACPDADGDGYTDAACGGTDCNDRDPAINPGAIEICGNGVDENCNGMSDDVCLSCPDGGVLSITRAVYNNHRLLVSGRANIKTRVSVEDAESGEVLAENIRVKGGKWAAAIRISPRKVPEEVKAINTNGCEKVMSVKVQGRRGSNDDSESDDN